MICSPADMYLTNAEIQRMTGLCAKSVRKLAERNKVRTRRIPGLRVVRYHRHDVEKLIDTADRGREVRAS